MSGNGRMIVVVAAVVGWLGAVASAAGPTTRGSGPSAERMREDAGRVMFRLLYVGEEDKGYYSEGWGPPPSKFEMLVVARTVITAAQARRVVDWMEREELLAYGVAEDSGTPMRTPEGQRYLLIVSGPREAFRVDLGWGPGMLRRVEGIRDALGGADEGMKRLLGRLAGEREKWAREERPKEKAQG